MFSSSGHYTSATQSDTLAYVIMRFEHFYLTLTHSSDELKTELKQLLLELKIFFENHLYQFEGYSYRFAQWLEKHAFHLTNRQRTTLYELHGYIRKIPDMFITSTETRFQNRSQRRFESELSIQLAMNPTDNMMKSVGKISQQLIKMIDNNDPVIVKRALISMDIKRAPNNTFGHQLVITSAAELKDVLIKNDKNHFFQIMLLHFILWRVIKYYAITDHVILPQWENKPFGKFNEYSDARIKQSVTLKDTQLSYIEMMQKTKGEAVHLSDQYFMSSRLFQDRGRSASREDIPTLCFGIMLAHQENIEYRLLAKKTLLRKWEADVWTCYPDFDSQYVIEVLSTNGVYVSGASGMTAVMLAMMEIIGDFATLEMKQQYVLAVAAYIVVGGYHSFHEILAPAENILGLISGYHAIITNPQHFFLPRPANYHHFFALFTNDPQFMLNYDTAWKNLTQYIYEESGFVYHKTAHYQDSVVSLGFFKQRDNKYDDELLLQLKKCIKKLLANSSLDKKRTLLAVIPDACHTFESAVNVLIKFWQSYFAEKAVIDTFPAKCISAFKAHMNLFHYLIGPTSWKERHLNLGRPPEILLKAMIERFVAPEEKPVSRLDK